MKTLRDPNLPAGEIVEKRKDGIWVRNDGVELSPAEKNPYYVLATVFGENKTGLPGHIDSSATKNRRVWNRWVCSELTVSARARLAELWKLDRAELEPLSEQELSRIQVKFSSRIGKDTPLPDPSDIQFSGVYFKGMTLFDGFLFLGTTSFAGSVFEGGASYQRAIFLKDAIFSNAHFSYSINFKHATFYGPARFWRTRVVENAYYTNADFKRSAEFMGSCFDGCAYFNSVEFSRDADFRVSHFSTDTSFGHAVFSSIADFSRAKFGRLADFSDGEFVATTRFDGAIFSNQVPKFFQRAFHDNTEFTTQPKNWPPVRVCEAKESRPAYRRLRQVAAELHDPVDENFFLRQEMACSAELQDNCLGKWIIKKYGFFSDYGYSVGRPVFWLLMTWIIGASVIHGVFGWYYVNEWSMGEAVGVPGKIEAYGLGLSNTFAIFGFRSFYFGEPYMSSLPAFVKVVGGVQTVLGFVFLFFLGLGLRNRFRLK